MKKALLLLALVALLSLSALAADAAGAWKGTLETPMGAMDLGLNVKTDAGAVSGTLNFMGNDSKVEKLKLDGDKISFEVNMEFGTMAYAGTIDGDTMKLNLSVMGNDVPVTLKRVK